MDCVTEENVEKIFKERENKATELEVIKNTSANQMWTKELRVLKEEYTAYIEERERLMMGDDEIKITKKKVVVKNPLFKKVMRSEEQKQPL